jgi:hypothetical protein
VRFFGTDLTESLKGLVRANYRIKGGEGNLELALSGCFFAVSWKEKLLDK